MSGLRVFYFSQFKSFFSLDGINVSLDHETFVMADVMSIIKTNKVSHFPTDKTKGDYSHGSLLNL